MYRYSSIGEIQMTRESSIGLIGATIKLMNPKKSMIMAFTGSTVLGALIAGKGFPPMTPTLLAIIASLFITFAAYIYNDIIDLDMDKESNSSNKEDRPLVTGEITLETAKTIVILCSIIGIVTAWFVNITVFGITLLWYGLFMAYSYPQIRLKRIFIVKTLVTSGGTALALLMGTSAAAGTLNTVGLFFAFSQWTFISLMLPGLSDSFDLEEDRKYGMKTMAMVFSWKTKVMMTAAGSVFFTVMCFIASYIFNMSLLLPVFCVATSAYYLKQVSSIYNEFNAEEVWRVRKIGMGYYYMNLVIAIISTLNLGTLIPFL